MSRGSRGEITFGTRAMISHGVIIESWGGEINIGREVFIGPHAVIYGHGGVTIGDQALIAMHCRIVSSNHTIPPVDQIIQFQADELSATKIGKDVWLGAGVTVTAGVELGDGCVIGAGSVVTGNIPAGAIAWGTPARIQRWREGASPN